MKMILAVVLCLGAVASESEWKDSAKKAIVELTKERDTEKTWETLSMLIDLCDTDSMYLEVLDADMNRSLDAAIDTVALRGGILKYKCESCRKALTDYREREAKRRQRLLQAELAAKSK